MQNKKDILEKIIIFFVFTALVSIINLNTKNIDYDRSWIFHMCQKVANGDIMYKDINIIVGPIFYLMGGMVLRIFGTNYFTFEIFGGVLYGIFSVIAYDTMKKINTKNYKIVDNIMIMILFYFTRVLPLANYNTLCLFFIILAMNLELKKAKATKVDLINIFIGITLGLAFYTKQTVAGMAVIATGLIWLITAIREKNINLKEVVEKALGFLGVLAVGIIIMLKVGNFYEYLNYCFGGILEFGSNNVALPQVNLYCLIILAITFASIFIIKFAKKDKEFLIITLYAIAALTFVIPLGNDYHKNLATFVACYLVIKIFILLLDDNKNDLLRLLATIFVVSLLMSVNSVKIFDSSKISEAASEIESVGGYEIYTIFLNSMIILVLGYSIIKERPIFFKTTATLLGIITIIFYSYCYANNISKKIIPNGLEIYDRYGIEEKELEKIEKIYQYIMQKEKEGYEVIGVSWDASKYMAALNKNNKEYDLLFKGNLGYKRRREGIRKNKETKKHNNNKKYASFLARARRYNGIYYQRT